MRRDIIGVGASLGAGLGSVLLHYNNVLQAVSLTLGVILAAWALYERVNNHLNKNRKN